MSETKETKKMVSFRMAPAVLTIIERVRDLDGTYFHDRDKTWLFERAIVEYYTPILEAHKKKPS